MRKGIKGDDEHNKITKSSRKLKGETGTENINVGKMETNKERNDRGGKVMTKVVMKRRGKGEEEAWAWKSE